jgi:hypothetical protein
VSAGTDAGTASLVGGYGQHFGGDAHLKGGDSAEAASLAGWAIIGAGTAAGAGSTGGTCTITAGNGAIGGEMDIQAGVSSNGAGPRAYLQAGVGSAKGGDVQLIAGNSITAGNGGNASVEGGDATVGNGGFVILKAGLGAGGGVNGSFFLENMPTAAAATAGPNAMPALVIEFLTVVVNGNTRKIPLFGA